jgi:glycerol-3-phosphate dehydrogenase
VVSRAEALKHYHGRDQDRITGGALWYDAQMYHSERLVLAVLLDAGEAGADMVNYVPVSALHVQRGKVVGAEAFDALGGGTVAIRARCVANASGPAIARLVASATGRAVDRPIVPLSKAMNILTRRIAGEVAIGVPSRHEDPNAKVKHGERLWFIAPWRDLSLIGTTHETFDDKPENFRVTEDEVSGFLDEINEACPHASLTLDDVRFVYAGLLPSAGPGGTRGEVRLLQHHRIIDHAREDAIEGLISLVGVKYTTSRLAAQQVVDRVCGKLGRSTGRCLTDRRPIFGGVSEPIDQFSAGEVKASDDTGLPPEQLTKLIRLYGTRYREVLAHGDDDERREDHNLLAAEVRYAVRQQMAVTLGDVIFRRTDLASRGHPGTKVLRAAAEVMAAECGWDDERRSDELAEVEEIFGAWRSDQGYRPAGLAPPADDRAAHYLPNGSGAQGTLSDGRVLSGQRERGS